MSAWQITCPQSSSSQTRNILYYASLLTTAAVLEVKAAADQTAGSQTT